jgi:DNA polymerase III subunit delta'
LPCGECRICQHTARLQQVDLSIVQPEVPGASIKVDQIRDLPKTLALHPYEARFRIALLLDFQQATASAQNALLKTLEEAPDKVILLVTADSAENLLPTIVSRCEVMRLRPMGMATLTEILHTRWHVPIDEARQCAHLAGGRLGAALHLYQDPVLIADIHTLVEDLFTLLESNRRERFAYADSLTRGTDRPAARRKVHQAIETWLTFWRDAMVVASGAQLPLINLAFDTALHQLSSRLDIAVIRSCLARLEHNLVYLDENLNMRLMVEVLLLDWPYIQDM